MSKPVATSFIDWRQFACQSEEECERFVEKVEEVVVSRVLAQPTG